MAKEKYFEDLQKIVTLKFNLLNRAIASIQDQEISNYPIIVISPVPVEIGVPLSSQANIQWHINASTLEELVVKNVVVKDKVDDFRTLYKSKADTQYCFFLVEGESATFVFHPKKG